MLCKDEEDSGLTPADDEDVAEREIIRKDVYFLVGKQYKTVFQKTRQDSGHKGGLLIIIFTI